MKILELALLVLLIVSGCGSGQEHFGRPFASVDVLSLAEVVENAGEHLDREVAVEARIQEVCQTAGCWCILEDGPHQLYVSMTSFALPADVLARRCRVEGTVVDRNGRLTLLASAMELLPG